MKNTDIHLIRNQINKDIKKIYKNGPNSLVKAYNYIFSGKGKRIRPILTLLTSKSLFGEYSKSYDISLAIEVLHNFTLVHDDIMDGDDTRHGKETVHKKWDVSTAILTGDALLSISLNILTNAGYGDYILNTFNRGLLAVCEGQAIDKEYENIESIDETQYLEMIKQKTAHMIAMSVQLGGLSYECDKEISEKLFNFGLLIGMGFQIQDDYLELTSSAKIMNKSLKSDLLLGKKTYPIILCNKEDKKFISNLITKSSSNYEKSINDLRDFLINKKIDNKIENKIKSFFEEAFKIIRDIDMVSDDLVNFTHEIMQRSY